MAIVKAIGQVSRGDIWWIDLGTNVGSVFNGIRPCVVLSNQVNNNHSTVFNVVPCSTKTSNISYHIPIFILALHRKCVVCPEQIVSVSKEQFQYFIESMSDMDLAVVEDGIKAQLGCVDLSVNKTRYKRYANWSERDKKDFLIDMNSAYIGHVLLKWHIKDEQYARDLRKRFLWEGTCDNGHNSRRV